jgi:hypothetical protein
MEAKGWNILGVVVLDLRNKIETLNYWIQRFHLHGTNAMISGQFRSSAWNVLKLSFWIQVQIFTTLKTYRCVACVLKSKKEGWNRYA